MFTAEAILDLRPWEQWDYATGLPREGTLEVIDILESALKKHASHPFALHLHIHALEAGPNPGRATASAEALLGLVPCVGHLQHMPSHIYVRTGRWRDAIISNELAIEADENYRAKGGFSEGFMWMYLS